MSQIEFEMCMSDGSDIRVCVEDVSSGRIGNHFGHPDAHTEDESDELNYEIFDMDGNTVSPCRWECFLIERRIFEEIEKQTDYD